MLIGSLASPSRLAAAKSDGPGGGTETNETKPASLSYHWNVAEKGLPLLGLSQERLKPGFDQLLGYQGVQFDFPIFRALTFDEARSTYLLPALKPDRGAAFIELRPTTTRGSYASANGIELLDRDTLKTVKTADGTKYLFVRYPDDEFRCATIKEPNGLTLNLLYTANGLALHGIIDSHGRSVTFNYGKQGIESVTQSWMSNLEGITRTWAVGDLDVEDSATRYAHARGKFVPANAMVSGYTAEMEATDKLLARIFGGPTAVVGGNGFEPSGLAASYPLYRGDVMGDDGIVRPGHLSHALHIYGSPDGRGDSAIYVPAGFASHSNEPTPTDAAVTFYYPRLGNLTDVTLAVFHVADFQIAPEGDRVRIGNLGGPGGSSPLYKHSHIEFYRGNVGLAPAAARAALRIDPATVFSR